MEDFMNFDQVINRIGTNAIKWNRFKDKDALPLWVADMDFQSPKAVINALKSRAKHGIFGYTSIPDAYYKNIQDWYLKRQSWQINSEDIILTPGVVTAISAGI